MENELKAVQKQFNDLYLAYDSDRRYHLQGQIHQLNKWIKQIKDLM